MSTTGTGSAGGTRSHRRSTPPVNKSTHRSSAATACIRRNLWSTEDSGSWAAMAAKRYPPSKRRSANRRSRSRSQMSRALEIRSLHTSSSRHPRRAQMEGRPFCTWPSRIARPSPTSRAARTAAETWSMSAWCGASIRPLRSIWAAPSPRMWPFRSRPESDRTDCALWRSFKTRDRAACSGLRCRNSKIQGEQTYASDSHNCALAGHHCPMLGSGGRRAQKRIGVRAWRLAVVIPKRRAEPERRTGHGAAGQLRPAIPRWQQARLVRRNQLSGQSASRSFFERHVSSQNFASLYVTPGLRLKAFPTTEINGQRNPASRELARGVFDFGAGVDVRVWRWVALRGEARGFYSGSPDYNVASLTGGQHNVFAGGA